MQLESNPKPQSQDNLSYHKTAVVAVSPLATVDLIDAVVELPVVVVVVVDEDVVQNLLRCI